MYFFKQLRPIIFLLIFCCIENESTAAPRHLSEQPLVEVLNAMQKKYEVIISYNTKDVKRVYIDFEPKAQEDLTSAISRALKDTGLRYKYLGLNFYTIYKNNSLNKRKIRKIERKIKQLERLGMEEDLIISNHPSSTPSLRMSERRALKGKITDSSGDPLIGATILVSGTNYGTTTDLNGVYLLNIPTAATLVEVSYTGFHSKKIDISEQSNVDIQLKEGLLLQAVTVFGSRGAPRTNFDSPVPIDHISNDRLIATGKHTLDEQLAQILPSFNSAQHPVSDAAAHFNPFELKGLLPSRTLVLVNGKRKNTSALLYSYVTASRGEVGVDLKSIMPDAIQSIEVLTDGAAAQYGSDAIAGVLNLVLKNKIDPFVNIGYSTTHRGDGTQYQASTGFSLDILKKGFATFTLGYYQQQRSQRAGKITSPEAEAALWGTSTFSLNDFATYLEDNPNAGFQVGLPDLQTVNLTFNAGYTLNKSSESELYAFGTLMNRKGRSPQFARGPYWVEGFEAIYPDQDYFLPEMAPTIADHTFSVGLRHTIQNWKIDISSTFGNNKIDYNIKNSFNQSLGADSPKDFYNGTHAFYHLVNNVDVTKTFFKDKKAPTITLAFGAEQRLEAFHAKAGEFASYGDGTPDVVDRIGSESFSGINPNDELSGTRNNIGFYSEFTSDLSARLQTGVATRFEHYSDFGSNLSWKWNARYKLIPKKINLRASISNGFRAPSLHQIYYASTTTTLTPEGIAQNRIINNLDPALSILGVPKLMPETSFNLGAGFCYKLSNRIDFSGDVYKIDVKDRIVLSGQIGKSAEPNSPINQLLESINTESAGFFLNAVNTTTKGLNLIFNIEQLTLGQGRLRGTIAANFSQTTVQDVHLPSFIEGNDLRDEVFSREDIGRLETWRPQQKILFTATYSKGPWSSTLSVNRFGKVSYQHPKDARDDATYSAKTLTDGSVTYSFNDKIKWQIGVQNLFNIYPDTFEKVYDGVPNDRNIDFVGRFKYPWQTMQIGIDGRRAFTKLNINF